MGKPHHNLSRGHDLARFTHRLDHGAVSIRCKRRIRRFVFCNARFGFCRGQLRLCRIQCSLGLFVPLH